MSYPYLAKTTLKYKSPHATDLSFPKDETIRVTGPNPDDEDWLIGEYLDGSKSGGFPKDFIVPIEESELEPLSQPETEPEAQVAEPAMEEDNPAQSPPPVSICQPAPPSPKLDPQSRLPTPGIAPSPAHPSPVEPSTPAPAPATTTSAQTKPTTNPADSPPRPQSMKDRLAFFAAAQDKPAPPPIKPKPLGGAGGLTWSQRQKLRQEQEAKEREANPQPEPQSPPQPTPAPSQPATTSSTSTEEKKKEEEGKGMSAADALSSITKGGSLKERMAALQGHGAFGGTSESKPTPPPVSSGKVWKRPPAPPAPEPEAEEDAEAEGLSSTDKPENAKSPPAVEGGEPLAEAEGQGVSEEEGEEDEEEKEKARRAAIAARMAKLGARGPMGMMAPAKPTRKPTKEDTASPAEEKAEPALPTAPATTGEKEEAKPFITSEEPASPAPSAPTEPVSSAAPPKSIPIAAMPRRTAPPKRRTPAPAASTTSPEAVRENPSEPEKRFETTDGSGAPIPPPQVMVAGEEDPLPKTESGVQKEKEAEEVGKGAGGLEGAAAAGIALAPVGPPTDTVPPEEEEVKEEGNAPLDTELPEEKDQPLVGAVAGADPLSRGTGTVTTQDEGETGEIIDKSPPVTEVEEGIVEGGDEKDGILKEAQEGKLKFEEPNDPLDEDTPTPLSPDPIGMVPIHPPASNGSDYDEDEPAPPLPPARRPRGSSLDVPLDELELKHEHDHTHDQASGSSQQPIEEDAPPPLPSQRRPSTEKLAGPRPLPSPGREGRALPPPPVGSALIPPREDSDDDEEEDDAPPPPPARPPQPPVAAKQEEEEEEDIPPPPPPGRHIPPPAQDIEAEDEEDVPPPLPSARPLPPPPAQATTDGEEEVAPLRDDVEEEEDAPLPPPPARKPSMPAPIQVAIPAVMNSPKSPCECDVRSPFRRTKLLTSVYLSAAPSPSATSPPTQSRTLASDEPPSSPKAEDEDATRRSGIAARMAKLGGIKFGMPPPTFKKPQNITSPSSEVPPAEEGHVDSPIDKEPPLPSPRGEAPVSPVTGGDDEGEETPEQEAARRRATLARLRAGGALGGFGLFNPGGSAEPEEPKEDPRGIEQDKPVPTSTEEEEEEDAPPPPPPGRPPVPSGRPVLAPPADVHDEEDAPPPPPSGRPTISTSVGGTDATPPPPRVPQTPTSPAVGSPVRTPSGRRPPVPTEKRFSLSHKRTSAASSAIIPEDQPISGIGSGEWQISDEPAAILSSQIDNQEAEDDGPPPPPPPNRPPAPAQVQGQSPQPSPRRSGSLLSRKSRTSIDIPPQAQTPSRVPPSPVQQQSLARQPSVSQAQGGRPGFDQLKEASQRYGAQLARSAHNIFSQGKKAQVGDGSPAGFVLFAMDSAQLPRPDTEKGWGQVVFEQEGGSILRRYDDPRPGDIAAFHDSKLRGKKGLSTYNQHVGSVEEPLIGVVAEFEERKHKLRILQVERGVPEEVSYRCEDLKSGKIIVYRPGL
ncbi:hypothetical protein L486_07477 [Kwoniella mangroviensis CBS 10435]|uniref:SH3 domain-containing protein n=1 Tax=Kwoniella mangroviensis CBS 10435 TaxID=1331196 RepID=A0A1B9IH23_9TREE|nr:hypothetical protein L486_07477 [Kwoniella mangroviensis CBS 10435]